MKAHQQHPNAPDTGSKMKNGWNKMQVLKPCTYINKSSGNVAAKCKRGAGFLPSQSHTEAEVAYKTGILMEAPPRDSKKLSARPPSHSGKIKLQLFPIDESIQKILQQEKHNPYLELVLAPRKKISSVVQHLNTKWGSAQCAKGSTIVNKPSHLVFCEGEQMFATSHFPSNFVKPSTVDDTNTIQAVDNQSKVAPLSWLDCISNISFGALLSEASPSQDIKQLPSQINSGLQQIPVTCDSFDAAIASLIARQQGNDQSRMSNPSLWEAEQTCHAFSFQNQTSKRTSNSASGKSSGASTASVLGAIPEISTDGNQQCSIKGGGEELNTQTTVLINDHNAKPEISMVPHESAGDPEIESSCSRLLSGTDSLGLTSLLTDSMDAFQNFSIF